MKVKDLLENINHYRKKYPDIDEWEIFTEQPELIAPDNNISYEDWFKAYNENEPIIDYNEEHKQWTVSAGLDDYYWFHTKEEAEECAKRYYKSGQEYYLKLLQSYQRIENLKKAGWKFKYDSEGWVYRDIANNGNHTLFEKDKIITINNNY